MTFTVFDPTQTPGVAVGSQNVNNILINGGMEFWQRGTSFPVLVNPGAYTTDRWLALYSASSAPTIVISQDSTAANVDGGTYSCKFNITNAGTNASAYMKQDVENYKDYAGQTLTYSARVKTSTASKYRIEINDGLTEVYSSYHTGGGTFETLSVTFTLSTSATKLEVRFGGAMGADAAVVSTGWIDSAMLVIGSSAASFAPKNYQTEFAQCQRYFQKIGGNQANDWIGTAQCTTTTGATDAYRFPVQMRTAPTMTAFASTSWILTSATNTNVAVTTIGFVNPGVQGFLFQFAVASGLVAGNASTYATNSTSAYVTADAEI